jgi:hypothetical protein
MDSAQLSQASPMARLGVVRYAQIHDLLSQNNVLQFGMYCQRPQASSDYRKELSKWVMLK